MSGSIQALLAFTTWAMFLGSAVILYRVAQVLTGKKKSNEFPAWLQHGSDFYWRVNRAHLNCLENLPIFATLVFVGTFLNITDSLFETLGWVVFGARLVQSSAHLSGGGVWPVNVRFTGFLVQYVSFAGMLYIIFDGKL
ncbi:MAPEG family protein [Leptospira perolatii]|uniref:MAPEG family protein n=1 Tax=Leptospira perolatii TaxID=2023191 RepID=A0A2M9ZMF1_9LEPT|nr:MAPEG family protein [Leptospira perolatii]PJZ69847.1 MAPEG family protein [Leptospira perolatii]PJZ73171.1 MAPEG family protein [Leptospira perolatii]